ncbi:gp26 family baseplate hub assembly chaperone [Granulicella arctica]|uniref:gp26 family baseplate hub assembly chaperone n=1 Tax=Granulicella arctica TaxID=940613 RepID=UPI0021E05670|nr:gp26 family baseplate hub assembly chaperone [Granulicella arctica]
MVGFNTAALLTAWEQAFADPPVQRAVRLLSAAPPEKAVEEWARLRVGDRDSALLDLQDSMFGDALETATPCPRCGEQVELAFTTQQVRVDSARAENFTLTEGGYQVTYRPPTSEDLLGLPRHSMEAARTALLARCVDAAVRNGQAVPVEDLPVPVVEAVTKGIADADPQAEVSIAIACPECGFQWSMDFDIASYLWTEIQEWAHRTLRDVHTLASAYGWSEREVLEMSSQRRGLYLGMVEG